MFVDRIQKRTFKVININLVTDSIDSLEHRRTVGVLSLFSIDIFIVFVLGKSLILCPGFLISRNVTQSHPYIVHIEFCRTDHFRNSFIPRISRLWNGLDSSEFPPSYDMLLN